MDKPFFSIIIPTLNEEHFLPKLLADLQKQTYREFEVIVIDGTSQDATVSKAYSFRSHLSIHVFETTKRNVSYQRNHGVEYAKGDYIVFLDADVRVNSSFLSKLAHEIRKLSSLLYIPQYIPADSFFQDKAIFTVLNFLIDISQKTQKPFSIGVCLIFEKNYFKFLGGFNDKLFIAEDHDIVQRAKKSGVTAATPKKLVVKASMRRFAREGSLRVLRKYFIATIHSIKTGGIEKKIFDYQMGGAPLSQNRVKSINQEVITYFGKLQKKATAYLKS